MKKLILSIILVCFLAIPAYAFNPLVVCGGGVAASGPTYDLEETFETSEYDNTACGEAPCVSEEAGDPNGDTANSGLDSGLDFTGTYSCALDAGERIAFPFGLANEAYGLLQFGYNDALENLEIFLEVGVNGDEDAHGNITILTNGWRCKATGGTAASDTGDSPAVDTDYWIKWRAKKATVAGDDAIMTVWVWNGANWTTITASSTDGTNTAQFDRIQLGNRQDDADSQNEDQYFDGIKIKITDTDPFPNDPTTY